MLLVKKDNSAARNNLWRIVRSLTEGLDLRYTFAFPAVPTGRLMHELLSFVPKSRPVVTPADDIRALVSALIDDIQIIAANDRAVILMVMAQYAHEQRKRVLREGRPHESISTP